MPCYTPLRGYKDIHGGWTSKKTMGRLSIDMEVACGQCLGCRLDRSRMWTARIIHEASLYEYTNGNSFITLTYNDENLPTDWSLNKSHYQKFMKRLRKKYPDQTIRFFHCGEYGAICRHGIHARTAKDEEPNPERRCPTCSHGRPHYHAILFNITWPDLEIVGQKGDHIHFTSPTLEKIWGLGHVQVGDVSPESAGYVARYCLKKINGIHQDDHYTSLDHETGELTTIIPEYATMSRNPGIGKAWYEQYGKDCFPADEVPIPGKGVIPSVPRYYSELYKLDNPEGFKQIQEKRAQYLRDNKEEFTPQRLLDKYHVKRAQIKSLIRSMD